MRLTGFTLSGRGLLGSRGIGCSGFTANVAHGLLLAAGELDTEGRPFVASLLSIGEVGLRGYFLPVDLQRGQDR